MKKRGLSTVLATAIIVSLTVIGTVILWNAIKPSIDDVEDKLDTGQLNAILDILKVDIIDGLVAKVTVKNRGTGSVSSVKIVISDEDSSKSYNVAGLGEFETKTFDVPLEIVKPVSVEAYPSIKTSSGKVIAGGVRGEAREKDISYSSDSLIGYWDFEEIVDEAGVKKVKDKSGRGSDLSVDPVTSTIKLNDNGLPGLGNAILFDGYAMDALGPPDALKLPGPLTLSFWFKYVGTPAGVLTTDEGLVGTGIVNYQCTYHDGKDLYCYIGGGDKYISTPIGDTNWHQIVFTWDGKSGLPANVLKLYVDGSSSGSGSNENIANLLSGWGDRFKIGTTHNGNRFYGSIDEVRVYDKALTVEEVNALYQQGQ